MTGFEIDLAIQTVTRFLEVGKRLWGLALSTDGRYAFTANGPSNDLSVIDLTTWQVAYRTPTGKSSWGVLVGKEMNQ